MFRALGRELSAYHVEIVAEFLDPPPLILFCALLAVVTGRSHVQNRLCSCFAALNMQGPGISCILWISSHAPPAGCHEEHKQPLFRVSSYHEKTITPRANLSSAVKIIATH